MTQAVAPTSFPKSEIKILLLENIHPVAAEAFRAEGFQVETARAALPEAELVQRVRDVHVLGIRSKTQVTPAVLAEANRMLTVGAFCIGTNQIALGPANRRGVPAFNAPFSNTRSVAELILAEVVMLSRHLGDRSREVHDGRWRKVAVGSHEVRGRTIGIVGYGHIGSQIGVLAEAFGMRVVFFDIAAKLPMGNNRALPRLEDVLEAADFVTLHVPETAQTRNLIGAAELARMKPGACLLNASRGSVVAIDALADAIGRGHIGGAAIDVYPEEPEGNSDGPQALAILRKVLALPPPGREAGEARTALVMAWNNACIHAHALGEYRLAVELADGGQPYGQENPYIFHSAACAYAAVGEIDRALEQVARAIEHEYEHAEKMETDNDLAPLQKDPLDCTFDAQAPSSRRPRAADPGRSERARADLRARPRRGRRAGR